MRASFGKVNQMHNHILPWTDRPLVTQNLVGGEEGHLGRRPVAVAPDPEPRPLPRGHGRGLPRRIRSCSARRARQDLTYVGRLRAYRDLTESTNLDFGGSFACGTARRRRAAAHLAPHRRGRHPPLSAPAAGDLSAPAGAHRARLEPRVTSETSEPAARASALYGSLEYQFARRWFAGLRYDSSERADDPSLVDKGGSPLLDVLAQRVQPGPRPVPPHRLRRGASRPTSCSSSSSSPSAPTAPTRSERRRSRS